MRVAVIGAGVVGVTSAWELAGDGHEVTVFERRSSVAAEASFAHAGLISPGWMTPWTAPSLRGRVLRQLFSANSPLRLRGGPSPTTLRWLWRWWHACDPAIHAANRARLLRLGQYSRARLHFVAREERLDYERSDGVLVLLRDERDLVAARPRLSLLAESGVKFSLIDAARCRLLEPGLNDAATLKAGIHLHDDEVGNCREFTHLMRGHAQRRGVRFLFDTEVLAVTPGSRPSLEHRHSAADGLRRNDSAAVPLNPDDVPTRPLTFDATREAFDAVVVCAAFGARKLLLPLGVRLPMAPVWGYSVTAPLRQVEGHPNIGPRSAVIDARHDVAITRLGERLRLSGGAELGGREDDFVPALIDTLYKALDDWFPGAAQLARVQRWKGARPMLPDGPPVLGASGAPGVWLNLGHGANGWALACGSARVVADAVGGQAAAIDTEGLDIARLR